TAACLAKAGHHVVGTDVNPDKVSMVNAAQCPIVEPGLDSLLAEVVAGHRLRATMSAEEAIASSDMALICVGTPSHGNGQQDLRALRRVAEEIGFTLRTCSRPYTVVLRSTVLPGTTDQFLVPVLRAATAHVEGLRVRVAVNPEFMREGSSIRDFFEPPFTVI